MQHDDIRWRSATLPNARPATVHLFLVLCCVCLLSVATNAHANVTSTFDQDAEGWSVAGSGEGPQYLAAGLPQGFICAQDTGNGAWNWKAPLAFLGNLSQSYGKALTFQLKSSSSAGGVGSDITLVGADLILIYDLFVAPGNSWTDYRVPLHETAGWRTAAGGPPTQAQMQAVLASVTDLAIRGNYHHGSSSECLDNVVLERIAPSPPIENITRLSRIFGLTNLFG